MLYQTVANPSLCLLPSHSPQQPPALQQPWKKRKDVSILSTSQMPSVRPAVLTLGAQDADWWVYGYSTNPSCAALSKFLYLSGPGFPLHKTGTKTAAA